MSSRLIVDCGATIKKVVPSFDLWLNGEQFPHPRDEGAREKIYNLFKTSGASSLAKCAIIQQYNEYYISNSTDNNVIVPVQFFSRDERGIPILGYTKFEPLASDKTFYKFSDEESLIEFGRIAGKYNIDFNELRVFMEKVKDLCDEFDLCFEDMMYNLSNIGYHKDYGFRIIDYGLCMSNEEYELVI